MQVTTKISFVGFLLAVATLSVSPVKASTQVSESDQPVATIESRLSRLTEAMKQREGEGEPLDASEEPSSDQIAIGWANGNRRSWGNLRRGGFGDRPGGSFINRRPWGNGGFVNRNWGDGGHFYNRGGWGNGGGFVNRW